MRHIGRFPRLLTIALLLTIIGNSGALAEEGDTGPVTPGTDVAPLERGEAVRRDEVAEELAATDIPIEDFGEIVVTATRTPALERTIPRSINVVTEQRIVRRGVINAVDALDDQVGIWVEKRTGHASDPVIRGLSGSNLLALIDGNTLSTFWGEGGFAGDDMYGKVSSLNVARIEVIRGPSSVLYGSNALGAVINFITKESPFDYTSCGTRWGGWTYALGGTSPEGWTVRQEGYGANEHLRWFAGVTYLDYGATRDGSGQWQSPTDAAGFYGDLAVNWKISNDAYAKFTVNYAGLDPTYRYYRPTQSNENYRGAIAGWLELPNLGKRVGFADTLRVGLYYQDKRDKRKWYDEFGAETKYGWAKWNTFSVDLTATKRIACHGLTYGIEWETTLGESPDDEQFTMYYPDGRVEKASPDSTWSSLGGYIQDEWKLSSRWSLTGSFRFDMLYFDTDVDPLYQSPGGLDPSATAITDWQPAFAGGLQASYRFGQFTDIYGGWSRGFRQFAPRFGVSEHAYGIVVPNGFLTPVTADQFELGLKHREEFITADAVGYYTFYNNFQNVVRGTYQGQDWYDYNGNGIRDPGEDTYVNVGDGEAHIYGVELAAGVNLAALNHARFGEAWSVNANFTYNYGQDTTNDIPLRHTQPMASNVRLRWEPKDNCHRPWAELQAQFVDRFNRIPPDRLANDVGYLEDPQDPDSGMRRTWGLPGYSVWAIRGGVTLAKRAQLVVGIDNIFDKLYRPAHARWDAPGRNFYASLSIDW